jgi:hypothetical protein
MEKIITTSMRMIMQLWRRNQTDVMDLSLLLPQKFADAISFYVFKTPPIEKSS